MFLDLVLVPSPQVTLHLGEHLYNKSPIFVGIAQIASTQPPTPPATSVIQAHHPDKRFDPLKVIRNDHKEGLYPPTRNR